MKELFLALIFMRSGFAARILAFFPLAIKSHHNVFRPILEGLADKGHEVIYYTGYPYGGQVPRGIDQVDISPHIPNLHSEMNMLDLTADTIFGISTMEHYVGTMMAHHILSCPPVQELIHSQQRFDAVLMLSYILQEYLSGFVHKFGAVGVEILPLGDNSWTNELTGLPDNPSYQLDFKAEMTQRMDFQQRLYNAYVTCVSVAADYYHLYINQVIMDRYFNYTGWESRPPIGRLLSNRSLILSNSHYAIGYPVPLPPHRVEVGGINVSPNKRLPPDIQKYMDESKTGVIYFSLGSNINVSDSRMEKIREAFTKAFQELPHQLLIKWETEYPGVLPNNVKAGKWLPQQDILAHEKCILFISHGGYLSLTEAVHFGVPVVGIPFFADQAKNMLFAEEAGVGKMLRPSEISQELLLAAVNEVLSNKSYKENMVKRSRMFRDRRHSAAEDAVYWIEHAIKYPNVLTPKSATLSFVQLHLLDVWAFLLLVLSVSAFLLWKLLVVVVRLLIGKRRDTSEKIKRN